MGRAVNAAVQRWCAWCGALFVAFWVAGFVVLGRFLPPSDPGATSEETVRQFTEHVTSVQLGLVLAMFGSVLLCPWTAILAVQMTRIEGPCAPLAYTQLAAGAAGSVFFVFPVMYMQIATYRQDRSPELIQLLNDMFWLPFVGVPAYLMMETLVLAVAILTDRRERPVFPRWAGYFNIWVTVIIIPAAVVVFFKSGPFAWNGLFSWWLPLTIFVVWFGVMTAVLLRAIGEQEAGAAAAAQGGDGLVTREEYESLVHDLERLSARLPVTTSGRPE